MRRSETPPSLLLAICLIAGATLLANFLAAISSAFLSPLFHTQSDWKVMVEVVEYSLGPCTAGGEILSGELTDEEKAAILAAERESR